MDVPAAVPIRSLAAKEAQFFQGSGFELHCKGLSLDSGLAEIPILLCQGSPSGVQGFRDRCLQRVRSVWTGQPLSAFPYSLSFED